MAVTQVKIKYEDRVVCFLDILGFREHINRTIKSNQTINGQKVKEIAEGLEEIRKWFDLDKNGYQGTTQITQFSDLIVISFIATEQNAVWANFYQIFLLLILLAKKGFLCRGGIVRGPLVHTDHFLFGPAMNEAYCLESQAANYPRVILHKSIVSLCGRYPAPHHNGSDEIAYLKEFVVKDLDGLYYIDYFRAPEKDLNNDYPKYLENMAKLIKTGLQNKDVLVRVKYQWMREKIRIFIKTMNCRRLKNKILKILS